MSRSTAAKSALFIGQAASGLVHDVANLTQAIMLRAEFVESSENLSPENRERLEAISDNARTLACTLHNLLEIGRNTLDTDGAREDIRLLLKDILASTEYNRFSYEEKSAPVFARIDHALAKSLLELQLESLLLESDEETSFELGLARTGPEKMEGIAPPWLPPCAWAKITFVRRGNGAHIPLEEEFYYFDCQNLSPEILYALQIRGLVRLHSGVLRVDEQADDRSNVLTVDIFLPDNKEIS